MALFISIQSYFYTEAKKIYLEDLSQISPTIAIVDASDVNEQPMKP